MYEDIYQAMENQAPVDKRSKKGLVCDACDMGPCTLYEDLSTLAPCGINYQEMSMKNLCEKIVEGLAEYNVHKHNLTKIYNLDRLLKLCAKLIPKSIEYTKKIDKILSPYRKERMGVFGIGGFEEKDVNICAIGPPEQIYHLWLETKKDANLKKAEKFGAKKYNVVSLGAPGAEMVYQMGIPCIGNSISLQDGFKTGAIDSVHYGKSPTSSILKALKNFKSRRDNTLAIPSKEHFKTGVELDADSINQSYRNGSIKGIVVFFGARSLTCSWDMQSLANEFIKQGYQVHVNGAHLYNGTELPVDGPSLIHLGFCEVGKIMNLKLDFKPTILVPGWKNPKLLTSSLAFLERGYEVIMGNDLFVTKRIKDNLTKKGLIFMQNDADIKTHMS